MRRKAKRKRAELEQQLQTIKAKMAANAIKANKMGKISNCRKGKSSQKERNNYCDANFIDDFIKNSDCKAEDQFCYICCENEFGNMFLRKREKCYDMCDESKKGRTKKGTTKITDGKWIWPSSLAYYVETYDLGLPADFLEDMANNDWSVPPDTKVPFEVPEGHVAM